MENTDVEALFDDGFLWEKTATNLIRPRMTFHLLRKVRLILCTFLIKTD